MLPLAVVTRPGVGSVAVAGYSRIIVDSSANVLVTGERFFSRLLSVAIPPYLAGWTRVEPRGSL
jgi:hypothetical protein